MEAKNQLDTSYRFWVTFKTSDNLIGWKAMPDNASPKEHIIVASTDISQDANNDLQKSTKSINPFQRYWWFFTSKNFGHDSDNTQLKQHDNSVASMDV